MTELQHSQHSVRYRKSVPNFNVPLDTSAIEVYETIKCLSKKLSADMFEIGIIMLKTVYPEITKTLCNFFNIWFDLMRFPEIMKTTKVIAFH